MHSLCKTTNIDSSCFISYVINLCNKHQVLSKTNYPFFLFFVIIILAMLLLYERQLHITKQLLKWKQLWYIKKLTRQF